MNETTTDPDGARVDRSPLWILFFLFGALLGAHAIYLMVLPSADPDHWRAFTSDPEMIAYLTDDFRASGAMQLGFAIMSMTIAGRWFGWAIDGRGFSFGTFPSSLPGRYSRPGQSVCS